MKKFPIFLLLPLINFLFISLFYSPSWSGEGAYFYHLPIRSHGVDIQAMTVIGTPQTYVVQKEETLLDIARNFDLGFSEIQLLYKDLDPWVPPEGMELTIPTFWILPEGEWNGMEY
jgi:L,D-transpeptidase ErfK/SrfK